MRVGRRISDAGNLRACSRALQGVEVLRADFTRVLDRTKPGDLVCFDPPYHPVSKMASFTGYDRNGFDELDQASPRNVFAELARQGVHVVLSNSDRGLVRRLYRRFRVERVLARRAINSRADRRGKVAEVTMRDGRDSIRSSLPRHIPHQYHSGNERRTGLKGEQRHAAD